MQQKDYYETLGVEEQADPDAIKKTYGSWHSDIILTEQVMTPKPLRR